MVSVGELAVEEAVGPVAAENVYGLFMVGECVGLKRDGLVGSGNIEKDFLMLVDESVAAELEADLGSVDCEGEGGTAALFPAAVETEVVEIVVGLPASGDGFVVVELSADGVGDTLFLECVGVMVEFDACNCNMLHLKRSRLLLM